MYKTDCSDELHDLGWVADQLDMSENTIRKRIKDGKIKAIKKGGRYFISAKEFETIPGPGEIIMPERYPNCVRYEECLDMHANRDSNRIFGCHECGRYMMEANYAILNEGVTI